MKESHLGREFPMRQENFELVKSIAYRLTGIKLTDHKKNMVYSRLARRIRARGLSSFDDYCQLLTEPNNNEITEFVNAITTNLTSFFRENHHFDFLCDTVFPELLKKNRDSKRIRFWSAGCSTGEEAYSIAMCLAEKMPVTQWDIKILATDLDTQVVLHGKRGEYREEKIESIDPVRQRKWFIHDQRSDDVKIKDKLRDLVTFKPLNLLDKWPMKGPFDVIFCRNVVIYFDKDTQCKLFNRYADLLALGGYLIIGHSENLHAVAHRFKSMGKTIYRKVDGT